MADYKDLPPAPAPLDARKISALAPPLNPRDVSIVFPDLSIPQKFSDVVGILPNADVPPAVALVPAGKHEASAALPVPEGRGEVSPRSFAVFAP